ncbi:MAG: phosphoglycerate kinase [Peptococcaceae bacterium]|nr:phosphoglycerate kinase [Peptococcaceae bacterium]MBP3341651.1 phosphoglycerate kinase [Peptococcaceae bacterium]MBQ3120635.1 phosphoglycerate kinase [Peptococcaceae bacterium]
MAKKSMQDIELTGKRVLVRVDFNVPRNKTTGEITNDVRIQAGAPTIKYLADQGAKVIVMTHMGRPKGDIDPILRLDKVAERLAEIIELPVKKLDVTVGPEVEAAVAAMQNGDVIMLENVRFLPGETKNDPELAAQMAKLGDVFVNDAFGTAHRAHCSTEGVGHILPGVMGFLMDKEISVLGKALSEAEHPFVAIVGGSKISDKIGVVQNLLEKVDVLMIGGGMANTFLKAKGYEMGTSLVEDDKTELALEIMAHAEKLGKKLLIPVDVTVATAIDAPETAQTVAADQVPSDRMALDIGPETAKIYQDAVMNAKTILWNGPMGVFEVDAFAVGTFAVANAVAKSEAYSIVGGGDSVASLERAGLNDEIDHISTGGGASLEFLEGKKLPGIEVLQDK